MSTWKLIGLFVAWVFASAAIAVVTAAVVAEALRVVGVVDTDAGYPVALNVTFGVVFVVLVAVPFVFRKRFSSREPYQP